MWVLVYLVGEHEDKDVGTAGGGLDVRIGNDVGRELDAGHVLDVFVLPAEPACQSKAMGGKNERKNEGGREVGKGGGWV